MTHNDTRLTDGVEVLAEPERLAAVLPPLRRRLLEALARAIEETGEPASASGLARRLDLPRQKVNYHLRELEAAGFVELAGERARRGCTERLFRPTARRLLVDPAALGALADLPDAGADPIEVQDRFSSAYLAVGAARVVRDVGALRRRAAELGQRLATMALEVDVHLRSPAELRAFVGRLAACVGRLAAEFDRPDDPASRPYHFLVGGHPTVTKSDADHARELSSRGTKGELER